MIEICLNATFRSDSDVPCATDFVRLWEFLKVFGGKIGRASVYEANQPEFPLMNQQKVSLASAFPESVLTKDSKIIFGGLDVEDEPSAYTQLTSGLYASGVWIGKKTLPRFCCAIRQDLFDELGARQYLKLLKAQLETITQYNLVSCVVDVCRQQDSNGGAAFGSVIYSNIGFAKLAEHAIWMARNPQGTKLRNIYWGNFLGLDALAALGGREQFLEEFVNHTQFPNGKHDGLIWEFDSGVFLTLSNSPTDFLEPGYIEPQSIQRVKWLAEKLVEADLL